MLESEEVNEWLLNNQRVFLFYLLAKICAILVYFSFVIKCFVLIYCFYFYL